MNRILELLQFVACDAGMTTVGGVLVGGIVDYGESRLLATRLREAVYVRTTKVTNSLPLKLEQAINDQVWLMIEVDAALPFSLTRGLNRILLEPECACRVIFYAYPGEHLQQLHSEVWSRYRGPILQLTTEDLHEPARTSSI